MSEIREFHILMVQTIKLIQKEVRELRAEIRQAPSEKEVKAIELKIDALNVKLEALADRVDKEERQTLVQRVRLGFYILITMAIISVAAAIAADLWRATVLPRVAPDKSDESTPP